MGIKHLSKVRSKKRFFGGGLCRNRSELGTGSCFGPIGFLFWAYGPKIPGWGAQKLQKGLFSIQKSYWQWPFKTPSPSPAFSPKPLCFCSPCASPLWLSFSWLQRTRERENERDRQTIGNTNKNNAGKACQLRISKYLPCDRKSLHYSLLFSWN